MKSNLIDRLRTATSVALVLCGLLLLYMLVAVPSNATLWADKHWAAEQEARAQSPEQLRQTLHFAVSRTSGCLRTQNAFLYVFMVANCGVVAFLGWNLFLLHRLKKEVSNGPNT